MDLEAAMKRLPPGARAVFVLHDIEGYRHEEIGTLLGVSIGTSKSQLHRARMTLRTYLNQAQGLGA
jgi:RNA polymerase sigma-70 factor (ECF subfamily)